MKQVVARTIKEYLTEDERSPYDECLNSLRDVKTKAIIRNRIDRIKLGNFGNCDPVGEGVLELKIFYGPGYRVYFAEDTDDETIVILLCGGDKSTQSADIAKAKEYWTEYRS